MSYKARVFKVFIASPSDVLLERRIIRNVLEQWNSINSEREQIVLVPIGWETNAAPEMGRPAQDYINMDILDTCDVVIGVFWTRAGTPTRNAASGSIEEILRESPNRRSTMLYFSNKPISLNEVDIDQNIKLTEFKNKVKEKSYYEEFDDEKDLSNKLYRHIQVKVNEGEFRPMWDSDIVAASENDEVLVSQINNHFPLVAENVLKKIIYQEHSDEVWNAITQKLIKSPSHMCDSLIFLAKMGACNNLVFRNGCVELAKISQPDFCTFLDDLKSINRYEFEKLYHSELLQDDEFRKYLSRITKRDQRAEQEDY